MKGFSKSKIITLVTLKLLEWFCYLIIGCGMINLCNFKMSFTKFLFIQCGNLMLLPVVNFIFFQLIFSVWNDIIDE